MNEKSTGPFNDADYEKFEKIVVLDNQVQVQRLVSILEEEGIPYRLKSYHDVAYDGIWQLQKGWGHLEALPESGENIRRILRELDEAAEAETEAGEPDFGE